jgi:hypothetical protein
MTSPTFPSGHRPKLFILGAQKCETASLVVYMQQHPDVVASKPKICANIATKKALIKLTSEQ